MTYQQKLMKGYLPEGYSFFDKREFIMRQITREAYDERSNPNSESFDPLAVIKEKL